MKDSNIFYNFLNKIILSDNDYFLVVISIFFILFLIFIIIILLVFSKNIRNEIDKVYAKLTGIYSKLSNIYDSLSEVSGKIENNSEIPEAESEVNILPGNVSLPKEPSSNLEIIVKDFNIAYSSNIESNSDAWDKFKKKYTILCNVGIRDILEMRESGNLENRNLEKDSEGCLMIIENPDNHSEYLIFPNFKFSRTYLETSGIKIAYNILKNDNNSDITIISPAISDKEYNIIKKGDLKI